MKINVLLLLFLISSCSKQALEATVYGNKNKVITFSEAVSNPNSILQDDLYGSFEGDEFFAKTAVAKFVGDEIQFNIFSEVLANPCSEGDWPVDHISFNAPNELGENDLEGFNEALFITKNFVNPSINGMSRIVSIDEDLVEAGLAVKFNYKNFVNGTFKASVCN